MKNLSTILVTSILLTLASACSKDENCEWNSSYLSGKSFKATKFLLNGADLTSFVHSQDPCSSVPIYFSENGTWSQSAGNGCNQSSNGTWSTNTSPNQLVIDGEVGIVENLSCNEFNLTSTDNSNNTSTITLTKQ